MQVSVVQFRPWAPPPKNFLSFQVLTKGGTLIPKKVGHLCSRFYLLSSKCIAACANRCWSALAVYFSASLSVSQPKIAISWCAVAPLFAAIVAPALRSPCAEHCGKSARSHQSRNLLPSPASVNGRPRSLMRNVMSPHGEASMTFCSAGRIGSVSLWGLRFRPLYCVNVSTPPLVCCLPNRITSERR
jgi:hypothetical protein